MELGDRLRAEIKADPELAGIWKDAKKQIASINTDEIWDSSKLDFCAQEVIRGIQSLQQSSDLLSV